MISEVTAVFSLNDFGLKLSGGALARDLGNEMG